MNHCLALGILLKIHFNSEQEQNGSLSLMYYMQYVPVVLVYYPLALCGF